MAELIISQSSSSGWDIEAWATHGFYFFADPPHFHSPLLLQPFHFRKLQLRKQLLETMGEYEKTPSEESFEFIETPPAPTPVPAPKDIGVRTTAVS